MERFRRGNGAAWLDLLSTLAGRYRDEQVDGIDTTESLRAWLREFDLEPAGSVTADDVAHAAETREALHRLAVAAVRQVRPAPADVRRLNTALERDEGLQVSSNEEGLGPRRPRSVDDALARLARQAAVDLSGRGAGTLRACGDDTCSSIFLDHTGRRRWCTDLSCGNRNRVRAHRQRAHLPNDERSPGPGEG
jgi:predicted RNA-binding Zn ribbon-like protein